MSKKIADALLDVGLVVTQQNTTLTKNLTDWSLRSSEAQDLAGLVPETLYTMSHEVDAVDAIKELYELRKEIEAARKTITQPFFQFKKVVDRVLGSLNDELQTVESGLKGRILDLRQRRQAEQREREEKARKDAQTAQNGSEPETPPEQPKTVKGSGEAPAGVTARKTYGFEVVDFALLPDTYKLVNEKVLRAMAKEKPAVPGVKWTESEILAVT